MDLSKFKDQFNEKAKKFGLPSFSDLNKDFEIEKFDRETETILRAVRKTMMERIVNSLGFLDMLLNPGSAPRMYYPFLKSMTENDRKMMNNVYSKFSDLSLVALKLELEYDEKAEAKMIKQIADGWSEVRADFKALVGRIENPGKDNPSKKERSYFG
jgi:hypothetical protein